MTGKRFYACLSVIVLLGLGARLAAWTVVENRLAAIDAIRSPEGDSRLLFPDSRDFRSYALSLSHPEIDDGGRPVPPHDEYGRQAWRTPLYSRLLAFWHRGPGGQTRHDRALNIILDLSGILLAGLSARRLARHLGWRDPGSAGALAALLYAMDPWSAFFSALILAETLASVSTLLATWLAIEWIRARRPGGSPPTGTAFRALACGGACGLTTLAKPSMAGYVLALAVFAAATRWKRRGMSGAPPLSAPIADGWRERIGGSTAWLALGFALAMTPWWAATARAFAPEFVPLSTMDSFVWYETVGPGADGGANHGKTPFPATFLLFREALAGDVWRDHPLRAAPPGPDGKPAYYPAFRQRVFPPESRPPGAAGSGGWLEAAAMVPAGAELALSDNAFARDLGSLYAIGGWVRAEWDRERLSRAQAAARFEMRARGILAEQVDAARLLAGESRNPLPTLIRQLPGKLARLWSPTPNWSGAAAWGGWVQWTSALAFGVTWLGAAAALWTARGAWRTAWGFLLPALYLTAAHGVMLASVRYRLPAWGGLCVLSGLGWSLLPGLLPRRPIRSVEAKRRAEF